MEIGDLVKQPGGEVGKVLRIAPYVQVQFPDGTTEWIPEAMLIAEMLTREEELLEAVQAISQIFVTLNGPGDIADFDIDPPSVEDYWRTLRDIQDIVDRVY